MLNISEQLIKDLINNGVSTFFGVQGGACARLIQNVVKSGGKFIPVLNEQSAGYYAHGYYLATKKTAGLIFTTGPGLTNGVSGIAGCYYDRVPLITLVGQVPKRVNIAKKTKTRMVGFQEVPHLEICKPISDNNYKIDSSKLFFKFRKEIVKNLNSKVQIIEILDDSQREEIKNLSNIYQKNSLKQNFVLSQKYNSMIKNSKNPFILLGAGFSRSNKVNSMIKKLKNSNMNFGLSWGAQNIQKYSKNNDNCKGLFGNHNPGIANEFVNKSDLIISIGCSLLQHQVGKDFSKFAPNAKILFVNNNKNECKRAGIQFGKRLIQINTSAEMFFNKIKFTQFKKIVNKFDQRKINTPPVLFLEKVFKKINMKSTIFSDAGATLSWSYQAANNLKKCPPIYTLFNLHAMGYSNCAAVGASIEKKNIFCVIGDGSVPMNSQEMFWLKKYPVKIIILDNKGYGIIRQTQREFYKSKFYGSDFVNKKSSLPKFNIKKMLYSFDIPFKEIKNKYVKKNISWFLKKKSSCALLVNVEYKAQVKT